MPRISCSTAFLIVAFSTTSCSTVESWSVLALDSASESLVSLVCWRMAILVSSGMPGMSFSAMALSSAGRLESDSVSSLPTFNGKGRLDSLDLPVPLRPTSAYRWPSFNRSLAFDRISMPSPLALALPLDAAVEEEALASLEAGLADLIVMLSPSTSSCRG